MEGEYVNNGQGSQKKNADKNYVDNGQASEGENMDEICFIYHVAGAYSARVLWVL